MPSTVPSGFEWISPSLHHYTGLRVNNTNSTWNGTTFQCIAFNVNNIDKKKAAPEVTLEVGGECNVTQVEFCKALYSNFYVSSITFSSPDKHFSP